MVGPKIQNYRIVRELGAGGMGVVYLAEDTELGRSVALKFLPEGSANDAVAAARFKREARAAAALDHPNICPIYELGQYESQLFIAMAYVEGRSMREVIGERPSPVPAVLTWARQIASGLAHAHAQGVVHRDIKPENLTVTGEDVVRILDFGIARVAGQTTLTLGDQAVGTLPYMSPEQLKAADVDHRTDIWSLGAVMYEMLTGRRPFRGEAPEAISYSILNEDVEPITALRSGVPLELERIVLKALARDPGHRYQHADELAADLDALASGEGPKVAPARRRRGVALITGVAAVLAAVIITYFVRPSNSIPFHGRDWILISDFENHTDDERFDEMVSQALAIDLNQSQYVNVFGGARLRDALQRMERVDTPSIDRELARELCAREGIPVLLTGSIDRLGDGYQVRAELVVTATGDAARTERVNAESAEDLFAAVDELSRSVRRHLGESLALIDERDEPLASATTNSLEALRYFTVAMKHIERADNEGAQPFLNRAIEADSTFALAWASLALAYHNLGDSYMATVVSKRSWEYRSRVTERERLYIEAEYYRYRAAYAQATQKFALLTELYPDDFAGHNNLAFLCQYTREYERALDSIVEAEKARPKGWHVMHNRALAYAGLGQWDSTSVYVGRALAISPQAHWTEIIATWAAACRGDAETALEWVSKLPKDGGTWEYFGMNARGQVLFFAGREREALKALEDELRYGLGASVPWIEGSSRTALGYFLTYAGRYEEAVNYLTGCEWNDDVPLSRRWYVTALARAGRVEEAERALDHLRSLVVDDEMYPARATLPFAEGEVALAKGDPAAAVRHFRRSLDLADQLVTRDRLAAAYIALGETELAMRQLDEVIRFPFGCWFEGRSFVWPAALVARARLRAQTGDHEGAAKDVAALLAVQKGGDTDGAMRRSAEAVSALLPPR